jgi:hypothetical protein
MLPTQAVRLEIGTLLAADATTLAPAASANKIALITAPFVLNENTTLASLTLASTGGLAPIAGAVGAQPAGVNPTTLQQEILIAPPAGGYKWTTSGATYPTTIYGYALTNNAGTTLLALAQLPVPITVTADGQLVDIDPVYLTFVLQPVS